MLFWRDRCERGAVDPYARCHDRLSGGDLRDTRAVLLLEVPEPAESVGKDRAGEVQVVRAVPEDETQVIAAFCQGSGNSKVGAEPVVRGPPPAEISGGGVHEDAQRLGVAARDELLVVRA